MKKIALPNGLLTSQLGFGCSRLVGGFAKRQSSRLVAAALDNGVTHFDVAPSYGMGTAEDVLRYSLSIPRDRYTLTTKVGIGRPPGRLLLSLAKQTLRPLLEQAPSLRQNLGRRATGLASRRQFAPDAMRKSLEESLRRLGTDYVDVLLLHEITPADVTEELLLFLDNTRKNGLIGAFGVGSQLDGIAQLIQLEPQLTGVVQTNWCVGLPIIQMPSDGLLITHGTVGRILETETMLAEDPVRAAQLCKMLGENIDRPALREMLLGAGLAVNERGLVLVSTSATVRIAQNAAIATNASKIERGARFSAAFTQIFAPKSSHGSGGSYPEG